ncbi:MAG: hypothetical protein E6H72_11720 [Betaproteobacteria bacterium]|nr:MAG: hypothetical protein E6H72_11720 [Betaproteobacteria bacterium]
MLAQTPMLRDDPVFNKLFAPDLPKDSPESHQAIKDAVDNAEVRALAEIQKAFETRTEIKSDNSEIVSRVINELQINNADTIVTREIAEQLHAVSDADVLLRFRITDYGVTPKSWRNAVIIFEVASTLGIAAIAYAYPATRPIAGIYLIEEGIEETIEAYAGFWALDEASRPVRIEAELIILNTGIQAWKSSATGLSDLGLTRLVRKVSAAERAAQLNSAIQDAAEKIVADLQKALPQLTKAGSGDSHATKLDSRPAIADEGRLIGQ